jgi:hypothetical protein
MKTDKTIVPVPAGFDLVELERACGAVFDKRRQYRYLLWRTLDLRRPAVTFVMLNPSAADEQTNDPTIKRVIALSKAWGFGRVFVVNLFAYMTAEPLELKARRKPVGENNDDWIDFAAQQSKHIVLAWGNHGAHRLRAAEVLGRLEPERCRVISVTAQGQPRHPLYTRQDSSLLEAPAEWWA